MKKALLILAIIISYSANAQFNKWSIEPGINLVKIRDLTSVKPLSVDLSARYMATTKFGVRTTLRGTKVSMNGNDVKFLSGQLMGVANFGRILELEDIFNNRWTILGGVGGDYTYSGDSTNEVLLHRISNFHLAGFVENEFRITDDFFLSAGLNVVTGVNNRPFYHYPSTETTSIINFTVKAVIAIGNKKEHADWYLEEPEENIPFKSFTYDGPITTYNDTDLSAIPKTEVKEIEKQPYIDYVYFDHDSYEIDKDALANIEKAYDHAKNRITITGYCSNVGSDAYNRELALNRGYSVKQKLVSLGFPSRSIVVVSAGIDNSRESDIFDMARRVEIKAE